MCAVTRGGESPLEHQSRRSLDVQKQADADRRDDAEDAGKLHQYRLRIADLMRRCEAQHQHMGHVDREADIAKEEESREGQCAIDRSPQAQGQDQGCAHQGRDDP
jgi:hypothetical protein